jgi:hypothetical protein
VILRLSVNGQLVKTVILSEKWQVFSLRRSEISAMTQEAVLLYLEVENSGNLVKSNQDDDRDLAFAISEIRAGNGSEETGRQN